MRIPEKTITTARMTLRITGTRANVCLSPAGQRRSPVAAPSVTAAPETARQTDRRKKIARALPACVARPEQAEGPSFVDAQLDRSDIRSGFADHDLLESAPPRARSAPKDGLPARRVGNGQESVPARSNGSGLDSSRFSGRDREPGRATYPSLPRVAAALTATPRNGYRLGIPREVCWRLVFPLPSTALHPLPPSR